MFTTEQIFTLNIVMMVLDLLERDGHAVGGVIAHGSLGGALRFERLEASLATTFH
jgi:hypothetical protein